MARNPLQMNRVAAVLFAATALPVAAQDCPGLAVLGLAHDPINAEQLVLVSDNGSESEIYSYPGWRVVNAAGTVLAEEEVNFFGLWGPQVHALDWVAGEAIPATGGLEVVLQLWTGFGEELACTVPYLFEPRSFEWTGEGEGECLPVRLVAMGYNPPQAVVDISLSSEAGAGGIWSTTLVLNEANNWYASSDSLCLAQDACYALTTASGGASVQFAWVDAALGFNWASWSESATGPVVSTWDLYGEDCATDVDWGEAAEVARLPVTEVGGVADAAGWPAGPYALYRLDGSRVCSWNRLSGEPFQAPYSPGCFLLVPPAGRAAKWWIVP